MLVAVTRGPSKPFCAARSCCFYVYCCCLARSDVKDPVEAAAYLKAWEARGTMGAGSWRFNKSTQSWILRHMYKRDKVRSEWGRASNQEAFAGTVVCVAGAEAPQVGLGAFPGSNGPRRCHAMVQPVASRERGCSLAPGVFHSPRSSSRLPPSPPVVQPATPP